MAKTITVDNIELSQVLLARDPVSGKILIRATYLVKSGSEVVKTTPDRNLTYSVLITDKAQPADLMTSAEQASVSAAWDAVLVALQRAEL